MLTENILPYGIHPSEVVIFLLFLWAAGLFVSVRRDMTKTPVFNITYFMYWMNALVFLCIQQFFDMLDNILEYRIYFSYLEHAAFLAASILLALAIYKSYMKYKISGEVRE